jgi:hypothetical protein
MSYFFSHRLGVSHLSCNINSPAGEGQPVPNLMSTPYLGNLVSMDLPLDLPPSGGIEGGFLGSDPGGCRVEGVLQIENLDSFSKS